MMPILPLAILPTSPGLAGFGGLPLALGVSGSVWLWGLLAVLVIWLAIRWGSIWQIRGHLHRPGSLRTVSPAEFPEHEQALLKVAHEQMAALGFHYWTALRCESTLGPANGSWRLVYAHQSPFAIASVRVSPRDFRFAGFEMKIQSWHAPLGRWIETTSLPDLSCLNDPGIEHIVSGHFADLASQWTAHQEHLKKEIGADLPGLEFPDADAWLRRESQEAEGIETLKKAHLIEPGEQEGTWRFTWAGARRVSQEVKIVNVTWDVPKPPPWIGTLPVETLIELEVDHWRRAEEKKQKAASGSLFAKLVMLGLTMALSAWAFQVNFKDPAQIAGLLVILLIHELGHLGAMWACGYKRLSILFIPFFGAAAVSLDKGRVIAWKEVLVVLMGPLPGLVVGLTGLFFDCWGHEWLRPHLVMATILNASNLLPLLPLDGGHLFRLALEARWPRLGAFFHTLSTGGLLLVGILVDQIFTYVAVARLLHFRMPWFVADAVSVRHRRFKKGPHGEWQPHTPEEAIREGLHAVWTDKKYGKSGTANRLLVARQIAEQLQTRPAGAGATCVALAACLSLFWCPVAGWFGMGAYYDRQLAAQENEMRALGMPVTAEEIPKHPKYATDTAIMRRHELLGQVMRQALDDPELDVFLTTQKRQRDRAQETPVEAEEPDESRLEGVVAAAEKSNRLNAITFPEQVPPSLTALVSRLHDVLQNPAPEKHDMDKKIPFRELPMEAVEILLASARHHRAAGRMAEWQQEVLTAAEGVRLEFQAGLTVYGGDQELLAEVEIGYSSSAAALAPDFLPRLNATLPTLEQRREQEALHEIATSIRLRSHLSQLGMPFEMAETEDGSFDVVSVLAANPFTKHGNLLRGRHHMRLWQAVHSDSPDRWQAYLAGTKLEKTYSLNPLADAGTGLFRQQLARPSVLSRQRQMLDHLARQSAAGIADLPLPDGMKRESLADGRPVIVWKHPPMPRERRPDQAVVFIDTTSDETAFWRLPPLIQATQTAVQPAAVTPPAPPPPAEPEPVIRRAEPATPKP